MKDKAAIVLFSLGFLGTWFLLDKYSPKVSATEQQSHILSLSNQVHELTKENRDLMIDNAVLRVFVINTEQPLL